MCFDERVKNQQYFLTILVFAAAILLLSTAVERAPAAQGGYFVYFGSYAAEKGQGIYVSRLDPATGKLGSPDLAAETPNPSFLAVHPNLKFLYAVAEIEEFNGRKSGAVRAFSIDPKSGKLTFLNEMASGGGIMKYWASIRRAYSQARDYGANGHRTYVHL